MHYFEKKRIMAKKNVSQETLELYNAWELLNGLDCVEMVVFPEKYNESVLREFYVNLTNEIDDPDSPAMGWVIAFSSTNIADFLSCPHYAEIEGIGLDGEVDLGEVSKVLTGDDDAQWLENNILQSS